VKKKAKPTGRKRKSDKKKYRKKNQSVFAICTAKKNLFFSLTLSLFHSFSVSFLRCRVSTTSAVFLSISLLLSGGCFLFFLSPSHSPFAADFHPIFFDLKALVYF
jgi:hypothetical protein